MRRAINTCTYNIIVTDAPSIHFTDFPVVKVHVDELPSARIRQNNVCAIVSASVNIKYHLPIFLCTIVFGCMRIKIKDKESKYATIFVLLDVSESKGSQNVF